MLWYLFATTIPTVSTIVTRFATGITGLICQSSYLWHLPLLGPKSNNSQRRDKILRFLLRPEFGQFSPHSGVMSLLNYTLNLERRKKSSGEIPKSSGDGAPKLQISVPFRGQTLPDLEIWQSIPEAEGKWSWSLKLCLQVLESSHIAYYMLLLSVCWRSNKGEGEPDIKNLQGEDDPLSLSLSLSLSMSLCLSLSLTHLQLVATMLFSGLLTSPSFTNFIRQQDF